jgi:type IV pilus assembly protein PilW
VSIVRVRVRAMPRRAVHGMTLVELMVGLAVGLFVSLIAISVFVSTRTLNVVNSSGARMGENARLAMEALQEDLRSAGFTGCQDPVAPPPASTLAGAKAAGFLDTADGGVAGYRGTGTGFDPTLVGTGLAGLTAVPDSDIVSVRVPVDNQGYGVTQTMATFAAAPQLGVSGPGAGSTLRQGDIVLISDCKAADIFQVTSADPAVTGSLGHIVGGATVPGNAAADLTRLYRDEASVYRLQTRHYYVAPSALQAGTRSLWRYAVPCPECGGINPQELASGVERLSVTWGIDTDAVPDGVVNRYVGAGNVLAWRQVVSARVQMLVATTQNGLAQSAPTIAFAGGTVVPGDRRLRTVLTEVIALRNRTP